MDPRTERIKREIEKQYKSVHDFAVKNDIPYSTLNSALKKGIGGMATDTVFKIYESLSIDISELTLKKRETISRDLNISELLALAAFNELNEEGQDEAIKRTDELFHIKKYRP